jgi:hypothetical protein
VVKHVHAVELRVVVLDHEAQADARGAAQVLDLGKEKLLRSISFCRTLSVAGS